MRNTPLKALAKSALKQKKVKIPKHLINSDLKVKDIDPGTISQGKEIKGKFDRVKFHPEVFDKDYIKKAINPKKHGYPDSDFSIKRKLTEWQ